MIPAGNYTAEAVPMDDGTWAQFGQSSKGTDQVLMYFRIVEGECAGETLPWVGYFSADAMKRTLESIRLAGFNGDEIYELPAGFAPQQVTVVVEHNTNPTNGKTYPRVAWVNELGNLGGRLKFDKPIEGDALRMLSAKLKAKMPPPRKVTAPSQSKDPKDALPAAWE